MEKCNECGAVDSDVAVLFGVICAQCYDKLPTDARCEIIEQAAERKFGKSQSKE